MNCGKCTFCYREPGENWGYCLAPIPEWLKQNILDSHNNKVSTLENNLSNYANTCEVFEVE